MSDPALDLAHRHDVDAVLVIADREADELTEVPALAAAAPALIAGQYRADGSIRQSGLIHGNPYPCHMVDFERTTATERTATKST